MSEMDDPNLYPIGDGQFVRMTLGVSTHIGMDYSSFNEKCFKRCNPYQKIKALAGQSINNYMCGYMGGEDVSGELIVEVSGTCDGPKGSFIKGRFCGISVTTDIIAMKLDNPDESQSPE